MGDVIEKRHEHAYFVYGRMNPPTVGHRALIEQAIEEGGDVYVFPTSTQNAPKNPLSVDKKVGLLKRMFHGRAVRIINTSDCAVVTPDGRVEGQCRTAGDVVGALERAGYAPENITLLVGEEERVSSFAFLRPRGITVRKVMRERLVNAGNMSAASMSATKVREAAMAGNMARFRLGINEAIPEDELPGLAAEIVEGMTRPKAKTARKRGGGKKLSRGRRRK
jgi:cytidyltransferase-like protein